MSAVEAREIHAATCRARKQGLVCATCSELDARVRRLAAIAAAHADRRGAPRTIATGRDAR